MSFTLTRRTLAGLGLALALLGTLAAAPNGSLRIDWWSVDGGGGASSGGAFSLSGTAGQADAGLLGGAGLSLHGGFWSGAAGRSTIFLPHVQR
ncbi:MAG TPA: hypothetical protein VD886_10095 [Herpetosiphonaceae bacterium]|nr:hypothetical protein [Herpetosiphonaceae bacterium]